MTKQMVQQINETKILAVEDEVLIAEYLKEMLTSLLFTNVKLAHNGLDALSEIEKFKPELILLDIRMQEELEGISLAKKINEQYQLPFIFITAHSNTEIVEKALNTNPYGYITKPFKKIDVYAAINLALKKVNENKNRVLIFKDGHFTIKLPYDDILFAESEGNYIHLHCINKKYTLRHSMDWFMANTPSKEFLKIHRSYAVNLKKIEKNSTRYVFINGNEIPVSRNLQTNLEKIIEAC
jgi:two-component system, LytTR family, response regulator LytT